MAPYRNNMFNDKIINIIFLNLIFVDVFVRNYTNAKVLTLEFLFYVPCISFLISYLEILGTVVPDGTIFRGV